MYDVRGKNSAGTIANPASGSNAQAYVVRKLADDNCWMVQNLNMSLSTSITLDGATSDIGNELVGRTWTPENSTTTYGGYTWNSTSIDQTNSFEPGEDIYFENGVGTGTINTYEGGYSGYLTSGDPWYHIGNFYSWRAATASTGTSVITTGNAADSICPKNWKLPDNDGQKSFAHLLSDIYSASGTAETTNKHLSSPLNFARIGYTVGNIVRQRGYSGSWWSTTSYSSDLVHYALSREDLVIDPQFTNPKGYGLSIRCVAR